MLAAVAAGLVEITLAMAEQADRVVVDQVVELIMMALLVRLILAAVAVAAGIIVQARFTMAEQADLE